MGLWSWLSERGMLPEQQEQRTPESGPRYAAQQKPPPESLVALIEGAGTFELPIVGESHYQDALEIVTGGKTPAGVDVVVEADLVLEDSNPYDSKAVRVDIQGRTVGYLDRETARSYRKRADEGGFGGLKGRCKAQIRGGWRRPGGSEGHFGVWLDLPVQK